VILKLVRKDLPITVIHSKCEGRGKECEKLREKYGALCCDKDVREGFERCVKAAEGYILDLEERRDETLGLQRASEGEKM
jgi:hypothetical protein